MQYLGDKSPGATFSFWFTTADADGLPTALAGTPAISVYKDNGNTESTSGVTLTVSADSRTGANRVVIDTSSDGSFYSSGSDFTVMITTGTVDSNSVVGYVVGRFTLRESAAYDAITAVDTKVDTIDSNVDDVKAKTDDLTFGVSGKVDANITHVNEIEVTGDGAPGTEWGPA